MNPIKNLLRIKCKGKATRGSEGVSCYGCRFFGKSRGEDISGLDDEERVRRGLKGNRVRMLTPDEFSRAVASDPAFDEKNTVFVCESVRELTANFGGKGCSLAGWRGGDEYDAVLIDKEG